MNTEFDYITPIKKQLDEKLSEVCFIFMTIGTSIETPRYYNLNWMKTFKEDKKINPFATKNCHFIYIGSTQINDLFFKVKCKEDYKEKVKLNASEFWKQFREYRTNFLLKNCPTINAY